MTLNIALLILSIGLYDMYQSYNIDIYNPLIKSIKSAENSSFGFSLSIFTPKKSNHKHILVGSPTVQVENSNEKTSGAFYSCPISEHFEDCTQRSVPEKSENSLFGYVIDAHESDRAIYTCAPRFLQSLSNVKYVEGNCWQLDDEYVEVETISNKDCFEAINLNPRTYTFRNCLTGGAIKSLGNKELLVTAPFSYDGRGLLIISKFMPDLNSRQSSYLRIDSYMSKNQLTGLSMTVGKIIREDAVRTVVLGAPGMPQSNLTNIRMGYGQVMLVKLIDSTLSFNGLIFGDSFGSGFGYSVLAIDLNNDGFDELLVGAPYTANNRGMVFLYWNQHRRDINEGGYGFQLSIHDPDILQTLKKDDSGQFGNCLENIGDINKDSYQDFAVGSPFEDNGRGSIYIYLGGSGQHIALSQKIEASKIDPDFRGFGFSIFAKNTDIDGNLYPDVVIGAAVSGHVIGLRARPLVRIYAENLLPSQMYLIPYNLGNLSSCIVEGNNVTCIKLTIGLFHYYPHSTLACPPNHPLIFANFTVDLDRSYLNSSLSKRVHFADRSNIIKDAMSVECKSPSTVSESSSRPLEIIFPNTVFFNISRPIDVDLKWTMIEKHVSRREFRKGQPFVDLAQFPVMDKGNMEIRNSILFGAGCTPTSCKPILTMQAELSLLKEDGEYRLYIGNSSSFLVKVNIQNIATSAENMAYNTFVKVEYTTDGLFPTSVSPGQYKTIASGLLYATTSPLKVNTKEEIRFNFSLTNDFIQRAEKYIYLNISLEGMVPQSHVRNIVFKIRILMVANIDMKVSITHIDHTSYQSTPIIGISAISDEKKIGPRLKLKISLSNNEHTSVVVSSKLVIYFPWEVAGDPLESHGQYLLYLLNLPKFYVSGAKRNITCDDKSLQGLINPIHTKIFESSKEVSQLQDVSIGNVPLPKKTPMVPALREELLLLSNTEDNSPQSDWEKYVSLNCMKGSARCIPVVCDLGTLSRQSGEINIELDFRIWIHTFVENFIKYKFVNTEIPIFWVPDANYDIVLKNPDNSFTSVAIKADNLQKPKAPPSMDVIWAVLIAIGIGIFLLVSIVLILYKCNFFRRQNNAVVRKRKRDSKQL